MLYKKYELTDETIIVNGHTLYRIRAVRDFGSVKAGDLGGFVENEDNLSHDDKCWIGGEAWVYGSAEVFENAEVDESAEVFGNATICENAWVCGSTRVCGDAEVSGDTRVFEEARVYGRACVYGDARVYGKARVSGNARVCERARVYENAWAYENALVCGNARVYGSARVHGEANMYESTRVFEKARVYGRTMMDGSSVICGNARAYGEARVYGSAWVCGEAKVYETAYVGCGVLSTDIKEDLSTYISCSLNVRSCNGVYYLYKRVNKTSKENVFTSCYNNRIKYITGKETVAEDVDSDFSVSCGKGLHVSTANYWHEGDTLILVTVKVEDIITCMEGKLRVRKLKVIGKCDE